MTHRSMTRVAGIAVAASMLLAACGGGGSSSTPGEESGAPSTAESMAESAAPSAAAVDLTGAADAVSNLTSYNLDIVINGSESGRQSLSITTVHDPVEASHYVTDGFDLITIQDQGTWINQDGTWMVAPGDSSMYLSMFNMLTPDALISSFSLGLFASDLTNVGTEEHNFVETTHYHLDASDLAGMDTTGFPDDGVVDIWIATDGGYLVGMQYGGTDPDTGEVVQMSIEVSGINDPSITIEPPI